MDENGTRRSQVAPASLLAFLFCTGEKHKAGKDALPGQAGATRFLGGFPLSAFLKLGHVRAFLAVVASNHISRLNNLKK
jgi:hypothetical protein